MLRRTLLAAALLPGVVLGACDRGGGEEAVDDAPTKSDTTVEQQYNVVADGDLHFTIDQKVPVRVVTVRSNNPEHEGVTLLSVGPMTPIESGPDKVRAAFDLTQFKGDGTYRIRAGSPRDLLNVKTEGKTSLDQSNVLFQIWPNGDTNVYPAVYDQALEPCPLTVKDNGRSGRLQCPKLTDQSGSKTFSLDMRWGNP